MTGASEGTTGEELATKLHSLFAGDAFSGMKVSVAGSTAVFAGTVADEALKEEAERAARALPGIENVRVDSLTVAPAEETEESTTASDKAVSKSAKNKTDETSDDTSETGSEGEEVAAADAGGGTETAETPEASGAEPAAGDPSKEDDQSAPA